MIRKLKPYNELLEYVESKKLGLVVKVKVIRENKVLVIPVTLGKSKAA